jgi:hypothetical protein
VNEAKSSRDRAVAFEMNKKYFVARSLEKKIAMQFPNQMTSEN